MERVNRGEGKGRPMRHTVGRERRKEETERHWYREREEGRVGGGGEIKVNSHEERKLEECK